jgi:hypothetical protein
MIKKFSAWILIGIIMFSFIRLLLIINNNLIPKKYAFIDFICIILLGLIILYIETPFFKKEQMEEKE